MSVQLFSPIPYREIGLLTVIFMASQTMTAVRRVSALVLGSASVTWIGRSSMPLTARIRTEKRPSPKFLRCGEGKLGTTGRS